MLKGVFPDYINAVFVNVSFTTVDFYTKFVCVCVCMCIIGVIIYGVCVCMCMFSPQGYKQPKAFIIAQGPMSSTCEDFWKMVYDRKCGAIVMLSNLQENREVGH